MARKENNKLNIVDMIAHDTGVKIKKEEMTHMYNLAAKKCAVGEYEKALELLQVLNILEPAQPMYMKATAGAYQGMGKYLEAFLMFQAAYALNQSPSNIDCLFYMAHCSIKQNKFDLAKKLLESFLADNEHHELTKKAKLLLGGVNKKLEGAPHTDTKK